MAISTITSKGQITVPKSVRDQLGLDTGVRLHFRVRNDGVIEMRPENVDLLSLFGTLKPSVRGVSVDDMNKAITEGATG